MKKFFVALLFSLAAVNARAQFCSNCIFNSAAPQQAQFNISSATIRGQLTVGSINISSITLSSATAGVFIGSGTLLTNLNASQLLLGTVPAARIAGAYSGITGLGTVASGVWNGTAIGTQFGGTGQNFSSAAQGALPVFTGAGTMGALAPPSATSVLMQNNVGTFFWTSSPTVSGENVGNIPLTNLQSGTLPYDVTVATNSIPLVLGSSVQGNISGNAANITGNLPIAQIAPGTLPNDVPASSITVTGVAPGYYGGTGQAVLINIRSDGRVASISQSTYSVSPSSITPGPLPSGVTIGASQITAGILANNVIASSIAASGVAAGSYVGTSQIPQLTLLGDGRLTSVTQVNIALPLSQLNSGTLPSGVLVPAASINAGSLGSQVIASSVAANGVVPGTYGDSTHIPHVTVSADGRITAISSAAAVGGNGAQTNVDNLWTAPQTFQSSITVNSSLSATNAAFTTVSGIGTNLTNLSPANFAAGSLPSNVIASSIAASGATPGEYGSSTYIPQVTVGIDGRVTVISSTPFTASPSGPVGGDLTGSLPNPQVIKATNAAGLTVSFGLSAQNAVFGALPTVDTITTGGSLTMASNAVITSSAGVISGGPMIDVRIYGAKCDGSTDDTAAIQAALNQFTNGNAGTGSGTLLFPNTLCSITSGLYYGGSPGYVLRLVGTAGGSNGSNGAGLVWNGAAGGTMLTLLGANNATVDDMEFNANNAAKYGVLVTATNQLNTTLGTAVGSAGSHTVTPGSIVNIATGTVLNVDSGAQFELVTVTGISGASFTATFAKTHSGTASVGNSAGSSGVTFRRDSFLNSNGANSAEVAAGNPSTTASNQISELHFANSNFFGGSNSVNGFLTLSAGNTKNYNFVECEFSNHQVHANLANASGVMNFYGAILGRSTVSDFVSGAASLNIDGAESEAGTGSQFVTGTTGANPGELTVKNSVFSVAASTTNHDIVLSYQGSVVLINNEFVNLRTSTAIPYIQIDDPLFITGSNDGNTILSESNWYLNAPAGYAPFYDANENLLLPTYYNHQPVGVVSIGDLGGPIGTVVKLYNYQPVNRLTSQTAQYVPGLGLLAAGTTDYAVVFRNDANTGDIVGLTKDHSDVVHVGDVGGVSVQSITSTGPVTSLSSGTFSSIFGDGSHLTGVTVPFPNTTSSSFTVTNSGGILASNGPVQAGNTLINTTGLALGNTANPAVQGLQSSGNSVILNCGSTGCFSKFSDSSGNQGLYVAPSLGFVGIGTTNPQYALHVSSGVVYVDGTNSGIDASTITLTQNGVVPNSYPNAPILFSGKTNNYLQLVGQNLSNGANASTDISLTGDLGSDMSFFVNIGINSSKFSQTGQSAEKSSSTYVTSSDSDLLLWAGTNGGLNSAQSESLIFGSSNPVSANIAAYILPATASGPGAFVSLSSFTVLSSSGVVVKSSITAGAYYGDGSHLTGVSGAITGLTAGVVPVALTGTTIGNGNGFITSVSTGVAITTATQITGTLTVGFFTGSVSTYTSTINGTSVHSGEILDTDGPSATSGVNGGSVLLLSGPGTASPSRPNGDIVLSGGGNLAPAGQFVGSGNIRLYPGANTASTTNLYDGLGNSIVTVGQNALTLANAAITISSQTSITGLLSVSSATTFTSSVTVTNTVYEPGHVRVSTGSTVFFPSTLGFSMGQTSFNSAAVVTGSTVSFNVQGSTVACFFSGAVGSSAQSGVYQLGVGVDGVVTKLPGTSATVGVTQCQSGTGTASCNESFYIEFQVASGQHNFYLGAWAASGTGTLPSTTSIAQFGCREVPSQ